MKREIDKHILQQTREKLGSVEINKVSGIKFTKPTEAEIDKEIDKQHLIWTKKYYTFDRNDSFAIGFNFYDYDGKKLQQKFTSNDSGGCYDGLIAQYTNAVYAIKIYCDAGRDLYLPIQVDDYTNLSLYTQEETENNDDPVSIIIPSESYYASGNVSLSIRDETWTTLYVFAYFYKPNSYINIFNGLLDKIDRWAMIDETPPDIPIWFDPPITTGLSRVSLTTINKLQWYLPQEGDWAGHHIYARRALTLAELMESPKEK